jgi:hypothetical protein
VSPAYLSCCSLGDRLHAVIISCPRIHQLSTQCIHLMYFPAVLQSVSSWFIRLLKYSNDNELSYRSFSRLRWSSGYRACHWNQASRVQTRPRTITIRSMTSFGEKEKLSAPCREILRHVKESYKYERDIKWAKFNCHFSTSFSSFANRYLCW